MKYPEASRASQNLLQMYLQIFQINQLGDNVQPFAWQEESLLPETITKAIFKISQTILYQLVKGTF